MPNTLQTSLPEVAPSKLQSKSNHLKVLTGVEVMAQLMEDDFSSDWAMLYELCPWSTVFQSYNFVSTWYKHYQGVYQPILIKKVIGGRMTGLLTLAIDNNGLIVGAGANQAEYQVWLTSEDDAEGFIVEALTALGQRYPHHDISLKFIPVGTPLGWANGGYWAEHCFRREVKQPLLVIDREQIKKELRKKNRREKMNRLKRLGELRFERLTTIQDFSAALEELTIQSDFRKGAMYNKCAFQEDVNRKAFLLDLYRQGLLHTTVLKIDEIIIASNVGVAGKGWLHLQGINTHSPFYARHSPGILHFLLLADLLAQEDTRVFDLTPGADPYKEALATDYSTATEIRICSRKRLLLANLKYKTAEYLKQQLPKAGLGLQTLRNTIRQAELLKQKAAILKSAGLATLLKTNRNSLKANHKYSTFKITRTSPQAPSLVQNTGISRDNLGDLLLYKPTDSILTRWEFLMDAMKKFELGQHCYTWSEGDKLLGCAWQGDAKSLQPFGVHAEELPEEAMPVYGFRVFSPASKGMDKFILGVATKITEQGQEGYLLLVPQRILPFAQLAERGFSLQSL